MQLEKYCIPTTCSLRDAMKHIDTHAERFAVVTDTEGCIAGVITDGNIRRALISDMSLDVSVANVMEQDFTSCDKKLNATQVLALMETKDFSHLPIIDSEKKLYGVWNRKILQSKTALPNAVVIMAGGLGTRLGGLTQDTPKPMLPVGGRPILEIVLESFRSRGFSNFYFSVNYKAEIIENYFGDGSKFNCHIRYIHEHKRLGTAGALSLLPAPGYDFFVVNGDILTHTNPRHMLEHHKIMQAVGTMLAKRFSMQVPYGVLDTNELGELVGIQEKPSFDFCVSAGMNVLSPKALDYIPKNKFFDMPDLIKLLMRDKQKVQLFETEDYWLDVGQVPDYERAQEDFRQAQYPLAVL